MSESFHVNMSYSGSVVPKDFFFNKLAKFVHFYDYLPFEEGPGPLFEQFKIPFTKG
jgi:hypothetical protein